MTKIGVISDDLTGCSDAGLFFADYGLKTYVLTGTKFSLPSSWDVLIINTQSRADYPEVAYEKVKSALCYFKKIGVTHIYKKIDSCLRGNIGKEIDAIFDVFDLQTLPFCAAFPKQNRFTKQGCHYLGETPISQTQFGVDPLNPIKESNILNLLKEQSKYYQRVKVYDVYNQNDLKEVALQSFSSEVICGAAGLIEELIPLWVKEKKEISLPVRKNLPSLIVCGSMYSINYQQISYLLNHTNIIGVEIDIKEGRAKSDFLPGEQDIIIYPRQGSLYNSQNLERILAHLTQKLANYFNNFIFIGGQTSFEICKKLEIGSFQIICSIETGIAFCNYKDYNFILKPGSFGTEDTLLKCLNFLKNI